MAVGIKVKDERASSLLHKAALTLRALTLHTCPQLYLAANE
jgi:hypothetical protein